MLVFFVCLFFTSVNSRYCTNENALNYFKYPTYNFSVRILDRVAEETDYHFVFSPLSTWMQLIMLAEGTRGSTQNEILQVTRYHRINCIKKKYRSILNKMERELSVISKRSTIIIVNNLLNVSKTYQNIVKNSKTVKILSLDFNNPEEAAERANEAIAIDMDGVITEGVYIDDFDLTMLLMTDTAYLKSDWKIPFNPVYTSKEPFYSERNVSIGEVDIMTQNGYYNITDAPIINARVLELPFSTDRVSMLIVLPVKSSVKDIFFKLEYNLTLREIFRLLKANGPQQAIVKIPKFRINTDIDNIPELLYDMGVKKIFYPELADFSGISNFKMHASLMNQIADIEVNESGVNANVAEYLTQFSSNIQEFSANRPFAYLIVDKITEVMLFAGIYSDPSIK